MRAAVVLQSVTVSIYNGESGRLGRGRTNVEVTGRVAERILSLTDDLAVTGEDSTGQSEATTAGVDLGEELAPLGVRVDVDGEDRAEDLLVEEAVVGRVGLVDGWVDVVTDGAVVGATGNQFQGRVLVGFVDDGGDVLEGAFVDHRAHEGLEVLVWVADGDFLHAGLEEGDEFVGARGWDVCARGGGAFLALVLEGAADGVVDDAGDVGGVVHEVEVLAAGFTDDARELAVGLLANALADLCVDGAEDVGGADEVEAREVVVGERDVGDLLGVAGDELHDVLGEAGLEQDLVEEGAGVDVGGRGLPEHDVAHQDRAGQQGASEGSEVEGGDGVDEAFQGAILHAAAKVNSVLYHRYTGMYLHIPSVVRVGCLSSSSAAKLQFWRQKSAVSAAASISACQIFLPWPSIVAAMSSYRYLPVTSSAALRKMDARSTKGVFSQSFLAFRADSIAAETCSLVATG